MSNGAPAPPTTGSPPASRLRQRLGKLADIKLKDRDIRQVFETEKTPAGAGAGVPQRLTFFVKKDQNSVVSLGEASGKHATDVGIVAKTAHHIHFETKAGTQTVMSLGAAPSVPTLVKAGVPKGMSGYSMVTLGDGYHHAHEQHYITSKKGDVILRTASGNAVLQAEKGYAEVTAGTDVALTSGGDLFITAKGFSAIKPAYGEAWKTQSHDIAAADMTAKITSAASLVQGAGGTIAEMSATVADNMKPGSVRVKGSPAWVATSTAKVVAGAASAFVSAANAIKRSIKVAGDGSVAATGGVTALLSGVVSASMSASLAALKGTVANVTAFSYASVWGGYTTGIKAPKSVHVTCTRGPTALVSKSQTSLHSKGAVQLVGTGDVQLNSEDASVSADRVYLGSSGFGLLGAKSWMKIGKVSSFADFAAASINPPHLTVYGKNTLFKGPGKGHIVELKPGSVNLFIRSQDSGIEAKASKLDVTVLVMLEPS